MSDLNKFGYKQELKRSLTLKDLIVYGLVWAVPIAPFVVFGYVAEASMGMAGLTYLLTMAGMLLTANSYARLSAEFPVAGSSYFYVSKGMSGHLGFLIGWSVILDYLLVPPLMYLFGALAMQSIMPEVPLLVWLVLFIGLATIINYRGVELTMKVNKYILGGQLIVLVWFLAACVIGICELRRFARFLHRECDLHVLLPGQTEKQKLCRTSDYAASRFVRCRFRVLQPGCQRADARMRVACDRPRLHAVLEICQQGADRLSARIRHITGSPWGAHPGRFFRNAPGGRPVALRNAFEK